MMTLMMMPMIFPNSLDFADVRGVATSSAPESAGRRSTEAGLPPDSFLLAGSVWPWRGASGLRSNSLLPNSLDFADVRGVATNSAL